MRGSICATVLLLYAAWFQIYFRLVDFLLRQLHSFIVWLKETCRVIAPGGERTASATVYIIWLLFILSSVVFGSHLASKGPLSFRDVEDHSGYNLFTFRNITDEAEKEKTKVRAGGRKMYLIFILLTRKEN